MQSERWTRRVTRSEQQERSRVGMADDHYSRPPRPNNPFARQQAAQRAPQPGGDPLAELARLIGQADPYAGYDQAPSHSNAGGAHAHDSRYAQQDEPVDWRGASDSHRPQHDPYGQQPGYRDSYDANAPYDAPSYPDQHYAAPQPHGYSEPHYSDQGYTDPSHAAPYYGDQNYTNGAAQDQNYAPPYADPQYAERTHDPRYADPQRQSVPQFASPQYDDKPYPAYDNQLYTRQASAYPPAHGDPYAAPPVHGDPYAAHQHATPDGQGYPGAYYNDPNYNDPNSPAYGAPYYQQDAAPEAEELPARRRGGLVTVLAVLALAVVGTAAAFGYRAVFAPTGTRVAPPVIKAETAPSKIAPAASDAKPIQDRVGDRAQIERIINREEQPVDVNAARAGAPRVVFPGPNPIAPLPNSPIPPSPASVQNAQASAPTGSAPSSTEPKKIRTVTIRSDQPELAAAAQATATTAPRNANVPSGVLPDDNANRAQASASSSGPLSLSPGGAQPAQRSAPARTAALPPAATAGGYSVQVTSQRSESEAQAAFAQLQAKFPSVLGNRQAVIRRADLGEKGTYYRAQIPFGSQSEAADFCTGLRSAGGQCVVQRN
jgi:hypothetical protein